MASGSRRRYTASEVRELLLDSDVEDSDGSDIVIEVIRNFCKTLTFAADAGLFTTYEVVVSCQCHRRQYLCDVLDVRVACHTRN